MESKKKLVLRRMHPNMISDDNYLGALGRLKTIQNARSYNWQDCLSQTEFNTILAARHHMLALNLWKQGKRQKARQSLLNAVEIDPLISKITSPIRTLHICLTS